MGVHFLASYNGCNIDKLTEIDHLRIAMNQAVTASGETILGTVKAYFPSQWIYKRVCSV
jgi:S-adenosylmethionine/arginine decarboxylase-like enzyme